MTGHTQRWITSASSDLEAWKSILIARSLRRSFTTRMIGVFYSDQVSEQLLEKLQDEFDSCVRVSDTRLKQWPNRSFDSVCRALAENLRGVQKFVFLNSNALVLKNADKLFRKHGVTLTDGGRVIAALISSNSRDANNNDEKLLLDFEQGLTPFDKIIENLGEIDKEYGIEINWDSSLPVPLSGDDIKVLHFVGSHPLDSVFSAAKKFELNETNNFASLRKIVVKCCEELLPELFQNVEIPATIRNQPHQNYDHLADSIAIVGMSCRFPGANSIEEFWELLANGQEGICKVPEFRWQKDNSLIRLSDVRKTQAGFLKCQIDRFDAKFFNTNSADLAYMDPQQRLSLQIVWEALEHAGINPDCLKNSLTGVFGGWWRNDYKEMLQQVGCSETDFFRAYMGNALGTLTARISHFLELAGPSVSTESGCSTSIVGVDMACENLRNESCDLALAVGANLLLHPFSINLMNSVISVNGRCRTFDADADGFGRAEGVAALILKRFSDAVSDGDRIWGVIRGSAVVQEGPSKSMGTPTVECEALAMQLAMERAGVVPREVSFVETHGTGTPVGDPLEVQAIAKAYSPGRTDVLTIGSVKTNIGHTESACGIAGIIKTVLSMKNEMIPKHLNFISLNPEINLSAIPARLPLEAIQWKKQEGVPRIAGVSSFGITGTDAHVIVQEPPNVEPILPRISPVDSRTTRILIFSGKTEEALLQQVEMHKQFLDSTTLDIKDIEHTLNSGRSHLPYRKCFIGSSLPEILSEMEKGAGKVRPIQPKLPDICFLFTGQGSQYPEMAKTLYTESVIFHSHMDLCEAILKHQYGFSIKQALWGKDSEELLKRTLFSQTAIFCVEYCLLRLWESWGITPKAVIGHSLGEFAAAVAAGILSFEDALLLVVTRSRLIDALPKGSMVVVAADLATTEDLMEAISKEHRNFYLDIAAINTSEQTVLAGTSEHVHRFVDHCSSNGLKTHILGSSHAFHSRLMEPMLEDYEAVTSKLKYRIPKDCVFVSGMEGKIVTNIDSEYWVKHTREPVRFLSASQEAMNFGFSLFLELGPHPVLSAMIMLNSDTVDIIDDVSCLPSLRRKQDEWTTILSSLGRLHSLGVPIEWKNFHRFSQAKIVDLPHYRFEEKPYWMEIRDDGLVPFHPLVGAFMPNPSGTKLFKNDLSVHRLPFLKDHALGDKLIFPGAGYMESLLTAGSAAMFCSEGYYTRPVGPVGIRNFTIDSPVCLSDKTPTEFQIIVSKSSDTENLSSTVYTKLHTEANKYKWIKHANAEFVGNPTQVDIPEFSSIRSICKEEVAEAFDYSTLEEYGYSFGPAFQTLTAAWKSSKEAQADYLIKFQTSEELECFILHPTIIDAMFQAQIFSLGVKLQKQHGVKKLLVPLSAEMFLVWKELTSRTGFIYVPSRGGEESTKGVHLFDEDGSLIASMYGTEFVETTISNIMALIESQRNPYPEMYDTIWRDELGPCERRADTCSMGTLEAVDPNGPHNQFSDAEEQFYQKSNELYILYMLQALKKLELESKIENNEFNWPEIAEQLEIVPNLKHFLRYILVEVAHEGWLQVHDETLHRTRFKITQPLPSLNQITAKIQAIRSEIMTIGVGIVDMECVEPTGSKLCEILKGQISALSILFPEGGAPGPAETLYMDSHFHDRCDRISDVYCSSLKGFIHNVPSKNCAVTKPIIRMLEVGAGTGSLTKTILNAIANSDSKFEYTYTDISNVFFKKGEPLFENTGVLSKFKTLNIEQDPMSQGFVPGFYDFVLASFVIHATNDVSKSLENIRKLLKPSGYLIMSELTKPHRAINLIVGGLEQFWSFTDRDIRPYNCEIPAEKWVSVLEKCGFEHCRWTNSYHSKMAVIIAQLKPSSFIYADRMIPSHTEKSPSWVVFGTNDTRGSEFALKLQQAGRNVVNISPSTFNQNKGEALMGQVFQTLHQVFSVPENRGEGIAFLWGLDKTLNYQEICEPFLYICKYLAQSSQAEHQGLRLVAYTVGCLQVGSNDFADANLPPTAAPIISMVKALVNEMSFMPFKCVDLDPSFLEKEDFVDEAIAELFTVDHEHGIAYRKNRRLYARLQSYKVKHTGVQIPDSLYYRMVLPTSNVIQDLRFAPFKLREIEDDEIEIEIKAYALNFRDLMVVIKPDPIFETFSSVGIDFAGVITKAGRDSTLSIGDRVAGGRTSESDALPSHLIVKGRNVFKIPEATTFNDASTLPVALATVSVALIDVADIREGDVVLIHTASGGVGLAAILVCQLKKCKIVATAGNDRKRNFLRSLGIKHVFNSRTTDYEKDIRKALNGGGVDVVLNTLTGPGFKEASLNLCKIGARFMEISKMNVWTDEDVQNLRPDVKYEIVDLSGMSDEKANSHYLHLKDMMDNDSESRNSLKPLPYTRFDLADVKDAFDFMQKARHVGKIVLTMPERTKKSGSEASNQQSRLFNDNATYMITGGMGGIGLEVGKWMSLNGAKHILLVGRSFPTKQILDKINEISSNGVNVIVRQCDVGDFEECKKLVEEFSHLDGSFPPLRGIMHAAGSLSDGTFEKQTWEKYETVFNAKIKGSWNLHQLTLTAPLPLEHFVMFSSAAATFGSLAQSNHAAGNAYLDSLAHYRNSLGLPGTTVNFGQWGQVGVAANLNIPGVTPFTVMQGIASLEHVLKANKQQLVVLEADIALCRKAFSSARSLMSEIEDKGTDHYKELDGDEFWKEYDNAPTRQEKYDVVRKYIKTLIRINLRMDKSDEIDDHVQFQEIGMDSLMMVEMKNGLQMSVGKRVKVSVAAVKDCKTVHQLAERLVELISGKEKVPIPTPEELRQLIIEDSVLPAEIQPLPTSSLSKISEISTILVTGASGTMGPYIIAELLKRPGVSRIYCLMRENKIFSPKERFVRICTEKKLIQHMDMSRLSFVTGDVVEPKLGMDPEKFVQLSVEVDAVVHLAVKASLAEYYYKTEDPKHSRVINVFGLQNVLSFVVAGKTKYMYHASTMIAETQVDENERFWEDWPVEGEFDYQPNCSYPISKFICERLLSQAVERGVPCKVFRFPNVGGDSIRGGNFQVLDNHLIVRMLAYLYIKVMPARNLPLSVLPVDVCAKFSVDLFFNEETGFEIFNVSNPHIADEMEFEDMAAETFGVEIEVVDPDEFAERVQDFDGNDDVVQIVRLATSRDRERQRRVAEENLPEMYLSWIRGNRDILLSEKLCKYLPEFYPSRIQPSLDILKTDLVYARDHGYFDKFGIQCAVEEEKIT